MWMVDLNSTVPFILEPVAGSIQSFVNIVQLFVGGLFGLYLILVILRWIEARQLKKLMKEMKDELRLLHTAITNMQKPRKRK